MEIERIVLPTIGMFLVWVSGMVIGAWYCQTTHKHGSGKE